MNGWAYWDAYLKQGKRKAKTTDRPIGSSSTKRVHRYNNGGIALRLHSTDCVIFYPDGSVAYDTGGWHTVTTFAFINEHGPVRVWRVKYQAYLQVPDPEITPAKIQKCRKCHGTTRLPVQCYGPGWCYAAGYSGTQACEHGQTASHAREVCNHGRAEGHPLPDRECGWCRGTGKVDYGSKRVHLEWDGAYYRFDPADPRAELEYAHPVYGVSEPAPEPAPAPASQDWGNSRQILTDYLPALGTVTVPYPCAEHHRALGIVPYPPASIPKVIIHLNDQCGWSRERVADWLETLDVDLSFPIA